MKIKKYFILTVLSPLFGISAANEDSDTWTIFGKGKEQERFSNCFIISYPSEFRVDPTSGISRIIAVKDVIIPEENLHTLVLHDPEKSIEVRASSYGFLSKEFYTSRGFKSPREVIFVDFFQNSITMKIRRMKDFDIFFSETDSKVVALFLDRDAEWGSCYQSLTFSFRKDTLLKDHAKVVDTIISKFIPNFARSE